MLNRAISSKKGFTLVEVIAILVILAILAAIAIPSLTGYIDKAKRLSAVTTARHAAMAAISGLAIYTADGKPGNGDKAYKKNIENDIIGFMDNMKSYIAENQASKNCVQVGLSLPSYFSQGWEKFIKDCKLYDYRNFVLVWVGKDVNNRVSDTVKAVYYVSADGLYAARIVYDDTTKLGSVEEKTGIHSERIQK